MKPFKSALLAAIVAAISVQPTFANLVTSISGGSVLAIPAANYFGPGPQSVTPGVTWSSTNIFNQGGSVFGYTGSYGFNGNGFWDGSMGPIAGVNDSTDAFGETDTMIFSFNSPVRAVGGFINYVPGSSNPTTIAVWDGNTLLESYNLTFTTNGGDNQGEFLGFMESTNDITSFTLTDNYIAITDLTAVPETTNLSIVALAFAALAAFGWASKRQSQQA
ncbi:MAG TPA: hypothetical protein VGL42_10170 [Opitutaceae bacterium]|jgi:hypothetical protein